MNGAFAAFLVAASLLIAAPGHADEPERALCMPTTLDEAVACLDKALSADDRVAIQQAPFNDLVGYHFSIGMGIRNAWKLWANGPLYRDLERRGFVHPDDMSTVIINSYWLDHHQCDRKIAEQAQYYQAYWERAQAANQPVAAQPPIPELDCTKSRSAPQ